MGEEASSAPHSLASDHVQEDCALHPQRAVPVVRFKESGASSRDEWGFQARGDAQEEALKWGMLCMERTGT